MQTLDVLETIRCNIFGPSVLLCRCSPSSKSVGRNVTSFCRVFCSHIANFAVIVSFCIRSQCEHGRQTEGGTIRAEGILLALVACCGGVVAVPNSPICRFSMAWHTQPASCCTQSTAAPAHLHAEFGRCDCGRPIEHDRHGGIVFNVFSNQRAEPEALETSSDSILVRRLSRQRATGVRRGRREGGAMNDIR